MHRQNQSSPYVALSITLIAGIFTACAPEEGGKISDEIVSTHSALTSWAPTGWGSPFYTAVGLECYQRDASGRSHFVCVADLKYTRIRTVYGAMTGNSFDRRSLPTIWSGTSGEYGTEYYDYLSSRSKRVAVNLSFFNVFNYPTQLSFPFKHYRWDGSGTDLLTTGTDCAPHAGKVKNLHIWWTQLRADIRDMGCTTTDFNSLTSAGSAPDIIGGLDSEFSIDKDNPNIRRTFIGVRDLEGYGTYRTLLIYSGTGATQDFARDQLIAFGAEKWMMFDGGGSSELIVDGINKVASSRPIPNALVVYAW